MFSNNKNNILKNVFLNNRIYKVVTVFNRVRYIILELNKKLSIQIVQGYAPTSKSTDEDAQQFYKDLATAINQEKTKQKIIMGDFNAKIEPKTITDAENIGKYELGHQNPRRQMIGIHHQQQRNFQPAKCRDKQHMETTNRTSKTT
ncbi:hypothetical protein RN001_008422 [Aquatica leii]|uniref:Craniofacial development protein 2-like n=1 Tax=Aquatica leii TaxID=1421715 RepID=A0AAN7S9N1_9COLE|nr:hypothetical protein RN001_008422 [Aquatica leii]